MVGRLSARAEQSAGAVDHLVAEPEQEGGVTSSIASLVDLIPHVGRTWPGLEVGGVLPFGAIHVAV